MDKGCHNLQPSNRRWLGGGLTIAVALFLSIWSCMPPSEVLARGRHRVKTLSVPQVVTQQPVISAESACLIDVKSGRILYEKHPDKRMRIASLTKIITAWIAVRSGKLDQTVTVSDRAVRQEGSSIYLGRGEKQTLRALVYGLMLRSGNDAATAIAEFLGGSVEHFALMMNQEVSRLGLSHSHFANPHGLDNPNHYSTAHDMAVITAAALQNPIFAQVVRTKYHSIPWPDQKWDRKMRNKNKLLWMLPGADGVKTGYTRLAGRCLASSMTRNGHQVALIVLRDGNDWVDSAQLLTYGLTAFERNNVVDLVHREFSTHVRFGEANSVKVVPFGYIYYPLHRDESADISIRPLKIVKLMAPVRKGQVVGSAQYLLHEHVLGTVKLVARDAVSAKGFFGRLREWFLGS